MFETEKKRARIRTLIILAIIVSVLLVTILGICWYLYRGLTIQYAPVDGIWYCEAIDLTLSYDNRTESYWIKDGTAILCVQSGHGQNKRMNIFEAEIVAYEGDIPIYRNKNLLFSFEYLQLEQDFFVVRDSLGEEYTFLRLT